MDFKPSQMRVLLAVVEAGNIVDAANRIGRSPSAVSMTLKQLGDAVGGAIFETDRKDTLTSLGEFLVETVRAQLLGHDRAVTAVQAFAKGEIGRVEMACVPSVADQVLPEVIRPFTQRWPHVQLDVRDIDTAAVVRAIERGTVEIGIGGRPSVASVDFEPLFHDKLAYVFPARSNQEDPTQPVSWTDIGKITFISNGITAASSVPEIAALDGRATITARNTTSLLALIDAGVGGTILPELSIPRRAGNVRVAPILHGPIRRDVGVIKKSDAILSPAARLFLEAFVQCVRHNVDDGGAWRIQGATGDGPD